MCVCVPGAVLAPLLLVGGCSRGCGGCSGQQNLVGSCTPAGALGSSAGFAKETACCAKKTWGRRAEALRGEEVTACIYPLAKDFVPNADIWKYTRIPWCRSRFPFLSAAKLGLQMPVLHGRALVFHLDVLPKKRREDCSCLSVCLV